MLPLRSFPWHARVASLSREERMAFCRARESWIPMNSMNPNFRNFALWVVIFLLVLALVTLFQSPGQRGDSRAIPYSQMIDDAEQGRIDAVTVSGQEVTGTYKDGQVFTTYAPFDPGMVERLRQKGVKIQPSRNPPIRHGSWRCS